MSAVEVNVWDLYDRVRGRMDDFYWAMNRAGIDRKESVQTEEVEDLKEDSVRRLKDVLQALDSSMLLRR